jgi:hypothetical protein
MHLTQKKHMVKMAAAMATVVVVAAVAVFTAVAALIVVSMEVALL